MSDLENRLLDLAERRGLLRTREAVEAGIPTVYLTRLVRKGRLERIDRGLYTLPGTPMGEHASLAEVAKKVPGGVICLLSALNYFDLGTHIPHAVWLALPAHSSEPQVGTVTLELVRMSDASFRAGVQTVEIDGVDVRIFDPSKTVADLFKFRSRVGLDVALEALREYWRSDHRDTDALYRYAEIDRVQRVLQPYVEMLAA